jgi:CHAD domain-containing protein
MGYCLERRESIRAGVRRVVREQIERAFSDLGGDGEQAAGIHQARKRFKKIRGVLRLVRPELGEVYDRENVWYRDTARRLASVRDADAMLEAFDNLVRQVEQEPLAENWQPIRGLLEQYRRQLTEAQAGLEKQRQDIQAALRQARGRLDDWTIEHDGFAALAKGLAAVYRRGRKAFERVASTPTDELLHECRKQAKYHWYHVRLVEGIDRSGMRQRRRRLRRLSELLGNDHDLAMLRCLVVNDADRLQPAAAEVHLLLDALDRRRQQLVVDALTLGQRLYKGKPRKLRRRWEARWQRWWIGAT